MSAASGPRVNAAPEYARPESEAWLCSLRLGVLDGTVSSRSLVKAFAWDQPIPGMVLAVQLAALSKKFEVGVPVSRASLGVARGRKRAPVSAYGSWSLLSRRCSRPGP